MFAVPSRESMFAARITQAGLRAWTMSAANRRAGVAGPEFLPAWSWAARRMASKFASGYSPLTPKTLDSILKLDTVMNRSPEEITTIWNDYHIGRGHISAVMGKDLFDRFQGRAKACPLFVIPLRKGTGYVSMLSQAQMPYLLFTRLEDFRARGSEASPYFTVTHHQDLAESKGLVLVRGDIVFTSQLSDSEAQNLLETAHSFYLSDSRYKQVQMFNHESSNFDFQEVLRELGMPSA